MRFLSGRRNRHTEEEERILTTTMGLLRRARKSNPSGTEGGKSAPQSSRIEERLRTARILAEEDDDDDELHGRSKRTKAQIERDLSDPRVHKRIVENLYGAYKSRVRFSLEREKNLLLSQSHLLIFLSQSFVLKCVFSHRVLSKDERDRRRFAFFETPTAVALISPILTRVRERKTARKKTKKPRWSGGKMSNGFLP